MDDGTTTLVGNQVRTLTGGLLNGQTTGTSFFTLTFVGTGLDIIHQDDGNAGTFTYTVTIDGTLQSTISGNMSTSSRLDKLVSGLPYGTHTVKIIITSQASANCCFTDFIIYQPKAPTLPVGAVQIADYNVIANYVANTAGTIVPSAGVLRKAGSREQTLVGTWLASVDPLSATGVEIYNNLASGYFEYTFFGTGIEWKGYCPAGALNFTYALYVNPNDVTPVTNYTAAGYSINLYDSSTGLSVSPTTGVLSGTHAGSSYGTTVSITNLPLGVHKLRVSSNTALGFYSDSLDIITPIHINHPSLKIGSLSLLDNSKIQAAALSISGPDLSKAKAWVVYDFINSKILSSYNVSQVLKTTTGTGLIYLTKPFKNKPASAIAGASAAPTINDGTFASDADGRSIVGFRNLNISGTAVDSTYVCVVLFGELLDE